MYDEVFMDMDLPVTSEELWQTKQLSNEMDRYLITEDGRLFRNANNNWWDNRKLPRTYKWEPVRATGRMDILGGANTAPAVPRYHQRSYSEWALFLEEGQVVKMFCTDSFDRDIISEELYDFQEDFVEKHGTCEMKIEAWR